MLERLDAVDWSSLEHAYGSAESVPHILERLASNDPDDHEAAFYDCYGSLCHQGTIYGATAAAIPFMLEILQSPDCTCRAPLLTFLRDVARGYGDREHVTACREAIGDGAPVFMAILQCDDDLETRKAAAMVLEATDGRVQTAEIAAAIAREDEPSLRAALWLSLGNIAEAIDYPERCDDDMPGVQLAWALGYAIAAGAELPAQPRTRLLALLGGEEWTQLCALLQESPSLHVLTSLVAADPAACVPVVAQRLEHEGDWDAANGMAASLLDGLFEQVDRDDDDDHDRRELDLSTLSETQRRALAAIARCDALWTYVNIIGDLRDYGVDLEYENARESLCRRLDVRLPCPAVIVRPSQVPAATVVARHLGREDWLEAPFVFYLRDDGLFDTIPEDPDAFPPEVMQRAGVVATVLHTRVIAQALPSATHFRFYPQLTHEALTALCEQRGWDVLAPDLSSVGTEDDAPDLATIDAALAAEIDDDDSDEQDHDSGLPIATAHHESSCIAYCDLSEATKAQLEQFVEVFDAAGWLEVKQWHATTKQLGEAAVAMTPLGLARAFWRGLVLEVGLMCVRGDDVPLTYLRLSIAHESNGPIAAFRFVPQPDAYAALVERMAQTRADFDPDALDALIGAFAACSREVVIDDADGLKRVL